MVRSLVNRAARRRFLIDAACLGRVKDGILVVTAAKLETRCMSLFLGG